MKKIKIIIMLLLLCIVTVMLGASEQKMYIKKEHFNNSEQVLDKLQSGYLVSENKHGMDRNTENLNECLSKRKRLTESNFYYAKMKILKREELTEKQKDAVIKEYRKNLKSYENVNMNISKIDVVRFKARLYNRNSYYDNEDIREQDKYNDEMITFVLIDEGEGFVVDYISEKSLDNEETRGES